jgi:hypothetical protein
MLSTVLQNNLNVYLSKEDLTPTASDELCDIRKYIGFDSFRRRFLSRLPKNYNKPENEDKCWNWKGSTGHYGYGQIGWADRIYTTHRISYLIFNGLIPQRLLVRHTCGNTKCVNPKHLILGTQSDNLIDMSRACRGGLQKLTEENVQVIKWLLKHAPEKGLLIKLARRYNVSRYAICDIKRRRSWRWVEVPDDIAEKDKNI